MIKHGNTLAPGDKVTSTQTPGEKRAGQHGKVLDVDGGMGLVRIEWAPGDFTIEDINNLERNDD